MEHHTKGVFREVFDKAVNKMFTGAQLDMFEQEQAPAPLELDEKVKDSGITLSPQELSGALSETFRRMIETSFETVKKDRETLGQLNEGSVLMKNLGNAWAQVAARNDIEQKRKKEARARAGDMMMLAILEDRIFAFEEGLADQYGENFALDMLAGLVEDGKISQDEYDRIAEIEAPKERRQAIATLVQSKLDSREMTLDDLKNHPWAEEWLDLKVQAKNLRDLNAEKTQTGETTYKDAGTDATDKSNKTVKSDQLDEAQKATKVAKADETENHVEFGGFDNILSG